MNWWPKIRNPSNILMIMMENWYLLTLQKEQNYLLQHQLWRTIQYFLRSKFEEDQSTKINPKKKYNKVSWNNKKTDDEKDKEKDTFKFNQIAPLVVENMNL